MIVQSALMHYKIHVGFAIFLTMYDKHLIVAVVRHSVLLYEILKRNDIRDGVFTKPHVLVVAINRCLLFDPHIPPIAL
jgi:hypothetical protein